MRQSCKEKAKGPDLMGENRLKKDKSVGRDMREGHQKDVW